MGKTVGPTKAKYPILQYQYYHQVVVLVDYLVVLLEIGHQEVALSLVVL